MLVNEASLGALTTGFKTIFYSNLVEPRNMDLLSGTTNVVPSDNDTEQYNWIYRLGGVREWIGPRVLGKFKAYGFSIPNKKWEDSVEVLWDDLEDDKLGQYIPQIQTMAQDMNTHYLRLLTALLEGGFTSDAYDGQKFFDTDHPVDSIDGVTVVKNTGTLKIGEAGFKEAINNLPNLIDERGDPLGIMYDTLICHPSKRFDVEKLMEAELYIHSGDSSVDYNEVRGLIPRRIYNPYQTDPEMWWLIDTSRPIKPFILQIRQSPLFQSVTNPNSAEVFKTDKFLYGVKARHNAGYALWQLAYGFTGTTGP